MLGIAFQGFWIAEDMWWSCPCSQPSRLSTAAGQQPRWVDLLPPCRRPSLCPGVASKAFGTEEKWAKLIGGKTKHPITSWLDMDRCLSILSLGVQEERWADELRQATAAPRDRPKEARRCLKEMAC